MFLCSWGTKQRIYNVRGLVDAGTKILMNYQGYRYLKTNKRTNTQTGRAIANIRAGVSYAIANIRAGVSSA